MDRLDFEKLEYILDRMDVGELVAALSGPPARTGRKPYDREPMVRALVAYRCQGMVKTVYAMHRLLEQTPRLKQACGFTGDSVSSRPTFSRVQTQMAKHLPLVKRITKRVLRQIKVHLQDLGEEVAVDSTVVKTHANPRRSPHSDPEAGWAWVIDAEHPKGKWVYGYKVHAIVDARYDIPLAVSLTPGNSSDTKLLRPLVRVVRVDGYRPKVVMADRGYDASGHSR